MCQANPEPLVFPVPAGVSPAADLLTQALRNGAQKRLVSAIEAEVAEYLARRSHVLDDRDHRQVVRNGHLAIDPKVATGDGSLGFWAALRKVFPRTSEQRCWVHKSANVLDKLLKRMQAQAKDKLHQIWMAPTKKGAHQAFDLFVSTYQAKYPGSAECLKKDRDVLLTFYDFPAEHWMHLRTTNPIESTFATVRLRHDKTRNNGSRVACLTMVFKLLENAALSWRKLNCSNPFAGGGRRHDLRRRHPESRRLIMPLSTTFDDSPSICGRGR